MNDQNSVEIENDSKEESDDMFADAKNVHTLKRTLNKTNSSPNNTKVASPPRPRNDAYKKAI